MTYQKQTWITGETITAQKLNHMEDGIKNRYGQLIVHVAYDEADNVMRLDKTVREMMQSVNTGAILVTIEEAENYIQYIYDNLIQAHIEPGHYIFKFGNLTTHTLPFEAGALDDYPIISYNEDNV